MSTHTSAASVAALQDDDDDEGEESWHDAQEEGDEEDEKVTRAEDELTLDELEVRLCGSSHISHVV